MSEPKLHLDMDTSRKGLYRSLLEKGHDVTHTPNEDVPQNASDEYQLLWATSHQRILFTFNVRDFSDLAKKHPNHAGIILANQKSTRISELIASLDHILKTTQSEDWSGVVCWITS
jgi:hypothetical protein